MPNVFRAIALALAMLIAHISHVLPHGAVHHTHKHRHAAPDVRAALAAVSGLRRAETLIAHSEPAPPPPPHIQAVPVAARLPLTGGAAPVHYSGSIAAIIQQAFAPLGQSAVNWAERVAMCESGDNPNARNPDGASGLFQFMPSTWARSPYASSSVFDPVANARAAAWLYQRSGPGAWSCS